MTIAATSSGAQRTVLRHSPLLALALAVIAVVLLALGPIGWVIVAANDAAGPIEASDRSRWFGFTDDIVIRITPTSSGSRIDLRSSSRQGRSDFGVNAARVERYLSALHKATAGSG
jgi:uncharacterized protein (DUF1499 family)